MPESRRGIKIAYIGGGSQVWAPRIIRDIIFKPGMQEVDLEFALLDIDPPRGAAIEKLFAAQLKRWELDRVRLHATQDSRKALKDADFVIITISTGRLEAMRHDLEVPERYSIYQTVGDTVGPGGWARALRNIPVFQAYAEQIKELAPRAHVLNYTNPLALLTKLLADELGNDRVIGLCHGLFESYAMLQGIFGLKSEKELRVRFGGLNHFFWILDFKVNGADGYPLLRAELKGRPLVELMREAKSRVAAWFSERLLASELFAHYGYLPYVGDRHTCEFFGCYITNREVMDRFKLVRTSVEHRQQWYVSGEKSIRDWTEGTAVLENKPSRETAADILAAITFNQTFTDVMNLVNIGQIPNLPLGAVVETMGQVDAGGAAPITTGPLPEQIRAVCAPHAEVQLLTLEAGLRGDLEAALMALARDPACAHLPPSDVKKLGRELLEPNAHHLPQFFPR